jgi:GNAT superfamily N-acetyltransferase
MPLTVRTAQPRDLPLLPEIESSSDTVFATVGIEFTPGPTVIEQMGEDNRILVLGDPPLGFAALAQVDGRSHLEQISVHGSLIGQGFGRLLLQAAIDEAAGDLTLITFRDVPWNGPWYARFGFTELPEQRWGRQLRAHWQDEIDARLHDLGPRLVMHRQRDRNSPRPARS